MIVMVVGWLKIKLMIVLAIGWLKSNRHVKNTLPYLFITYVLCMFLFLVLCEYEL